MNAGYFIAIVLVSGFVAGTIHGAVNLAIVEPYLDKAIGIENQNLFASGEAEDTPQFWVEYNSYRDWQKSGQLLAGGILGMQDGMSYVVRDATDTTFTLRTLGDTDGTATFTYGATTTNNSVSVKPLKFFFLLLIN